MELPRGRLDAVGLAQGAAEGLGGPSRTRTDGLLNAIEALFQLSYGPRPIIVGPSGAANPPAVGGVTRDRAGRGAARARKRRGY